MIVLGDWFFTLYLNKQRQYKSICASWYWSIAVRLCYNCFGWPPPRLYYWPNVVWVSRNGPGWYMKMCQFLYFSIIITLGWVSSEITSKLVLHLHALNKCFATEFHAKFYYWVLVDGDMLGFVAFNPVGVQYSSRIPDGFISCSSESGIYWCSDGRLNFNTYSFVPEYSDAEPWLQIMFNERWTVYKVATQVSRTYAAHSETAVQLQSIMIAGGF